jgi:DNA-binding transcriptional regulator YhcF (GntR family)
VDVDRFSDVPPYRQVGEQLRDAIRAGEITDRLPSARDIAQDAGVAQFTAIKALRLVREWGYAKVTAGMGTWAVKPEDWPEG